MARTPRTRTVYDLEQVNDLLHREPIGSPPKHRQGYLTFYDTGRSILRLRDTVQERGQIFFPQTWYKEEDFARREDTPRYRQLRMEPVPDSFRKTYDEQKALLPKDEHVPSARIVIMGIVLHFLATGERLLPNCYVRTSDRVGRGRRVVVGLFVAVVGLGVYHGDDNRNSLVGLSSLRSSS